MNILILNVNEGTIISITKNGKIPGKGGLSIGIIIVIVIVGILFLCGIAFLIIKFVIKKRIYLGNKMVLFLMELK